MLCERGDVWGLGVNPVRSPQDGNAHSGWALNRIELLDKTPGLVTVGYFSNWITQATGSGTVFESHTYKALYDYSVTLTTGQEQKGPFTGGINMRIHGWWGSTEDVEVVPKGKALMPGSSETFSLRAADIGCPSSIDVTTVGGGVGVEALLMIWIREVNTQVPDGPPAQTLFFSFVFSSDPLGCQRRQVVGRPSRGVQC